MDLEADGDLECHACAAIVRAGGVAAQDGDIACFGL